MKQPQNQRQPVAAKVQRRFSREFKRAKVAEIEAKIVSVAEVCRSYQVTRAAVYKWIKQFSQRQPAIQTVVQLESEQHKTQLLRQRLEQLEAMLGRKQLEVEYLSQLLAVSSEELGIDLKKSFGTTLSTPSDETRGTATGR